MEQLSDYLRTFLGWFDLLDLVVIAVNILLMAFAKPIMRTLYHNKGDETQFVLRVRIFRAFNFAIIGAFIYYHIYLPAGDRGPGISLLSSIIVLYVGYVAIHGFGRFIHLRYGKPKELDGTTVIIESYNSRLLSIIVSILISILVIISVVRILGYDSWLEAGGVLGFIGVFLALTQNVWMPDLFSGLILLNSGMFEKGDVLEVRADDTDFVIVHKTRLFHTELLNLVNNHRLMIRNAKLRDLTIHNLSKFASAKGLREKLIFNIGYDVSPITARKLFERVFQRAIKDYKINVETHHPIEVRTLNAGDFAVEYACFYYTKDVRNILLNRHSIIESAVIEAAEHSISLSTPMLHSALVHRENHNENVVN